MATIVKNEIKDYLTINVTQSEAEWLSTATYNRGDIRRDGNYLYAYAGLSGTNSNINPSASQSWVYMYPTNYYAMIDGQTNQKTTKVGEPLIFELPNNYRSSLSLLETDAVSITVEIIDIATSDVLYTISRELQDERQVIDFYTYCFSGFVFKKDNYFEFPVFNDTTKIKVTIDNGTNDSAVGRLVFGYPFFVGETEFSGDLNIESYSVKQTNEFGETVLIHRGSVNLENYIVRVPIEKIPMLKRKRKELDAIPVLFVMDEDENSNLENLQTFGYFNGFNIQLTNKRFSMISLSIKGVL